MVEARGIEPRRQAVLFIQSILKDSVLIGIFSVFILFFGSLKSRIFLCKVHTQVHTREHKTRHPIPSALRCIPSKLLLFLILCRADAEDNA